MNYFHARKEMNETNSSNLTPDQVKAIRSLASIKDRDPDTMTEQDYDHRNNLAEYLFGTVSLHDAFSHKHPEFCLSTVLWMTNYGPLRRIKSPTNAEIYSSNGIVGGSIRVHPQKRNLARCLADARTEPNGIYLYFEEHSNIIWLDVDKMVIHRYDPQISKDENEAEPIDGALGAFFKEILPQYTYFGNTLTAKDCVQGVRWKERGHLDCYCQEYTLLYARNRLEGMSHEEAARDLVNSKDNIIDRIEEFYAWMCA